MTTFYGQIGHSRTELEQSSVETANTSDAVAVITNVQSLKRNMKSWERQVLYYSIKLKYIWLSLLEYSFSHSAFPL